MRRSVTFCVIVCVLFSAGCKPQYQNTGPLPERETLEQCDAMEVFALDPSPGHRPLDVNNGVGFHGWPVLRRAVVPEGRRRQVAKDMIRGYEWANTPLKCFEPRHGVRVKRGERTVDYVICFVCNNVYVYGDGERGYYCTSHFTILDDLLKNGEVPADPNAKP